MSDLIDLGLVREHLRVDSEDVSDSLLTIYRNGAVRGFERRTGRVLLKGDTLPSDAPPNALLLDDDILSALLMLISHRNDNRGVSSEVLEHQVPMGAADVMDSHRWFYD